MNDLLGMLMFDDGFWLCRYIRLCQEQVTLVHPKVQLLMQSIEARLTSYYVLVASSSESERILQNKNDTNNTQI